MGMWSLDDATGGSKKAKKSQKKLLNEIRGLFSGLDVTGNDLYAKALGEIDKVGSASRADAMSRERQAIGGVGQNLASSGLWSPYMAQSASRGIRSDTTRQLGQIDEQLAQMRANLFTGQAGFKQGNVFNLAGILGGVQHQPGTNWLLEGAKVGALMSDRRLKRNIRRVGTHAGMNIYDYEYIDGTPGTWRGVMADEVPQFAVRRADGYLAVDYGALERATGFMVQCR